MQRSESGAGVSTPAATVLVFSPRAWDPTWADQLAHFDALLAGVPGVRARLMGIARDGLGCDVTFGDDAAHIPVRVELDPGGTVAARYGVRGEPAVIVVDEEGREHWRHDGAAPRADELVRALRALSADADIADDEPSFGISPRPTRRQFVATALGAALTLATMSVAAKAEPLLAPLAPPPEPGVATTHVTLRVNGRDVPLDIEPRVTLLDALREYAGLTATKKGCDHGQCGACTVHVNGRRQLSCLTFAMMHQGDEITTLEGLANGEELHPMQAAFIEHDGFQCGYCTPGQIMSAVALLKEPCGRADADVKECMSGNICLCGAYPGIVAAIQDVRAQGGG